VLQISSEMKKEGVTEKIKMGIS